ncbi:MAG: N-acetylmuramoyl-L-alanine amidase [Firmicutes bacterium]|nr:N-acetylmuramoyl-L-alanine amidase [Bacillota bacterium]
MMRTAVRTTASVLVFFFGLALIVAQAGGVAITAAVVCDATGKTVNAHPAPRIVIDPGHGGRDAGVSAKNGTRESDITLAISRLLASELEIMGAEIIMTRDGEMALYDENAPNRKMDDMRKRHRVIERAKPDLVVSIHMNSFPGDNSVNGLQCFYHEMGGNGRDIARRIQTHINKTGMFKTRPAMPGDYFILETAYPSVLIECGFLSNPPEAERLATPEYQRTLAAQIAVAIWASLEPDKNPADVPNPAT